MTIRHIIFDCDGVLVDSEPLSMRADVELLAEHGITLTTHEAHTKFVGKTFQAMIDMMEQETGRRLPPDLTHRKNRRLLEIYALELHAVPHVKDVLSHIAETKSIASNSPRHRVEVSIDLTGLRPFFDDRITTFEDVVHGKPEPDVFLEAARRAGLAPAACLVVEDSVTGATAAVRAGCRTLGFTGTHHSRDAHAADLLRAGALQTFDDMRKLPELLAKFGY